MSNLGLVALNAAVEQMKVEERQERPPFSKDGKNLSSEPLIDGSSASVAARLGWTVGQRDMVLKMSLDGKSLAEIRSETGKPAVEIARVLLLNVRRKREISSRRIPEELVLKMSALLKEGFKAQVVAEIFNADGVRSASGKPWTKSMINSLLYRRHKMNHKNKAVS